MITNVLKYISPLTSVPFDQTNHCCCSWHLSPHHPPPNHTLPPGDFACYTCHMKCVFLQLAIFVNKKCSLAALCCYGAVFLPFPRRPFYFGVDIAFNRAFIYRAWQIAGFLSWTKSFLSEVSYLPALFLSNVVFNYTSNFYCCVTI